LLSWLAKRNNAFLFVVSFFFLSRAYKEERDNFHGLKVPNPSDLIENDKFMTQSVIIHDQSTPPAYTIIQFYLQ
jgi:hypothetical protein